MPRNLEHKGIKMGEFRTQRTAMGIKEIDNSVGKVLTTQAQGPEFESLEPTQRWTW